MITKPKPSPAMKEAAMSRLGRMPEQRKFLTHAANTWGTPNIGKPCLESSFMRYFYKPQLWPILGKICVDILELEKKIEAQRSKIIGDN